MSKNHEDKKVVDITEVQNMEPQENPTPDVKPEAQKTEEVKKCWITKVGESIDTGKRNRAEKRAEKKAKKAENANAKEKKKLSTSDKVLVALGAAAVVRTVGGVVMNALDKRMTAAESETENGEEITEETDPGAPTEE